jgi:alpha-mannosidase
MDLPVGCSADRTRRLDETRPVPITSVVRLRSGEPFVRVTTTVDNVVKDHILRVLCPADIAAGQVHVEMPYDVVARGIEHPDTTGWREPYRPVQPQRSFVDISGPGAERGFALINAGNGQYEAVDSPRRELALTLLRCFRQWNSVRVAEYPDQVTSQCPGTHTFEYALYPHAGDWVDGGVVEQSRRFNLPMKAAVSGPGEGDLPTERGLVAVDNPHVELTALKKAEWADGLVLRLVNRTGEEQTTAVTFGFPVAAAERMNLKETESLNDLSVEQNRIQLNVPAHKIVTVRVT